MDCSICLDQIQEGQEDSLLELCNHRFHRACLDPWMETHSTCPNCRGPILNHQQLSNLQHQRNVQELDRIYLTYILFTWILQGFRGPVFKRHSNAIFSFISQIHWESIRPIAFTMTPHNRASLSCLKALRMYCMSREHTLFQQIYPDEVHRVIHRNSRCVEIRQGIQPELLRFQQSLS